MRLSSLLTITSVAATIFLVSCSIRSGSEIFHQEGCIHCHSFNGTGGSMGPDLTAVSAVRSTNWISSYIANPRHAYPRSRMPAFPSLSRAERKAVAEFLDQ